MIVDKSQVITANRYLSESEKQINATYIKQEFIKAGWTLNAICGMLGNMDAESNINPGLWESLQENNTSRGFGLTQWTPATKLIDYANNVSGDYHDIDVQISRILYELKNGVQFYKTNTYPISFKQFSLSKESPEYLAGAFLYNYERPAVYNIKPRQERARKWWNYFVNESGEVGEIHHKEKMSLLLMAMAIKRR